MATKFVYTTVEVEEITAKYAAGTPLEVLAETYAKSVPSIRMKLVKLGVYQKANKIAVTKTIGGGGVKKPSTSKSATLADFNNALTAVGEARW